MDYKELLEKTINEENKLYNEHRKFATILQKLDSERDFHFLKFMWHLRRQNITLARLNKVYYTYSKFLVDYDLPNISQEEFDLIFLEIRNCKNGNSTKLMHLVITKQILKFFKLHKTIDFEEYKIREEKKLLHNEELITEDEKHIIISKIKGLQHRVFFTILFDSGLRVGEVFSIDRSCFKKCEKGYLITIQQSKTTIRTIFTYSHNYYIEDLLKSSWESWTFGYRTTYNIIKRFEKKLGKRLYHHLARHTKATELSQKLTEQELKKYFGWTPNSKMLNNYIHLNEEEVLNKIQSLV